MEKKKSGLATAGLVVGIIGAVVAFIPLLNTFAYVLGGLALIFGLIPLCKKASVGKAVAALILGIAAIAITIVMQASLFNAVDDALNELDSELGMLTGEKTDDILNDHLDVSFGEFEVTKGEFLDECKLTVTLKNKGAEQKSFTVEVEAVDADGNRLETDYIYADDLKAGQSQVFEIFTLVTSDMMDKLEDATFSVLEVSMM